MFNPARGTRGMATAPHALAAQSALRVLTENGNAIEAMIAAAATIAVVYPHMNSIGGDSFWLISVPGQDVKALDASGRSGERATREWYAERGVTTAFPFRGGLAANTVAATVSGWQFAHAYSQQQLGGKLPIARLFEDAIHYARHGFPVTASQANNTKVKFDELKDIPGFAATFLQEGQPPREGNVMTLPGLADTFEHLARAGLNDFYAGDIAKTLAQDLQAAGSPLTADDLASHGAEWRTALRLQHSQGDVFNHPPSCQGLVSLIILGLMDRFDVARMGHLSADYVHHAVEATKRAFMIRDQYITDPARMTVDAQSFLEPARLDKLAKSIDPKQAMPWGKSRGPGDTVWMGAIDREGRAVSFIQSTYHEFGSGVVSARTGIVWQNRGISFSLDPNHVNTLAPRTKPFHTLNPALARLSDGRTMVYGNMGGDGQPQSQSAVFTRIVTHGMNPAAAIAAPRWLLGRTWGNTSETLKLESRFGAETVAELKRRGHEVEVFGEYDEIFGHAGAIVHHPNGTFEGASDPRSDGAAAGW